jgi:hypothetical protein
MFSLSVEIEFAKNGFKIKLLRVIKGNQIDAKFCHQMGKDKKKEPP